MKDVVGFEAACKRIDVLHGSSTSLPDDKPRILSAIKAGAGVRAMQNSVQVWNCVDRDISSVPARVVNSGHS